MPSTRFFAIEEWKPVTGYADHYEVSSLGNVKRVKYHAGTYIGRILKPRKARNGYLRVYLSKGGEKKDFLIHRIVAEAFFGTRPNGFEINHKSGVKADNGINNLEYVSKQANMSHSVRMGLSARGGRLPHTKLTEDQVRELRSLKDKMIYKELAENFGICAMSAHAVVTRKSWKHVA